LYDALLTIFVMSRYLHSFPTRRSSDLVGGIAGVSVVVLAVLSLGSSLFPKYMKWSPANAQSQASDYLLTGVWQDSLTLMIFTSLDRKSTRLNSSHVKISYAVFCLKKKD